MATLSILPQYGRTVLYSWALTQADTTGDAGHNPGAPDRSVQVTGNFDGATLVLEGTNDPTRTEWSTLHDTTGTDLTLLAAGLFQLLENPLFIRPRATGAGATTALTVRILSRSF